MIKLSDHFSYGKLLRFTLPSIIMMIFTSIYGVVDGFFVSNFAGATPFAAVNLIMPFLMLFSAIGFMIGTGGSALVAKTLGEGKKQKARTIFSLLIYTLIVFGVVFTVIGQVIIRPVAALLGAEGDMLEYCVRYGRIILVSLTAFMLQNTFQSFLVTAERPKFGLIVTILAGVTNVVLDALFVVGFRWGVEGAALATAASECVGGLTPLVYFILPNKSPLNLGKTSFCLKVLVRACTNGASEFMTNISMSIVNIFYNFQLMKLAGEAGVAAYGVIMYVNFIFISVFLGYSIGCAPVIGFHYGAQNHRELSNLFTKSIKLVAVSGVALTILAKLLARPLSLVFVSYDKGLFFMTLNGFRLYSLSFAIAGFNVFASAFFTALNNGMVSAVISFVRTLLFQIICVMVLPELLGLNGIWLSIVVAELLSLSLTVGCFIKYKERYHYL